MSQATTLCAGIDTAKRTLDAAVHGRTDAVTVGNDAAGWRTLVAHLVQCGVARVGIEATGGYERGVVGQLRDAGIAVVVLQPLQVKAFAKLYLRRAKTDRIDAALIAACTAMMDPQTKTPPDPRFDALADHLTFIEQTEEDIVRHKTRLEHIHDKRLRRIADADIARLEARRRAEIDRLATALRAQPDLARRMALVESIPGIGQRTALAIVVRMPELGQIDREAAAALAGLAPFVQNSGQQRGQAHIGGGRARLRRSLYAAALPAAFRWNPQLVALYQRLVARGKGHKCALVACARKLLVFANTVVARGTPWQPTPAAAQPAPVS